MKIIGTVTPVAHGTARVRNEKIAPLLYRHLPELKGFDLGTLNLRVTHPVSLKIKKLFSPAQTVVPVPKTEYSWRKKPLRAEKIRFIPVAFSSGGKISREKGFLYIASRSSRPRKGILELMSRENLRNKYGIEDGDEVEIEVMTKSE